MLLYAYLVSFGTALVEFATYRRWSVIIPYALVNPLALGLIRLFNFRDATEEQRLKRRRDLERYCFLIILFNAPGSLVLHSLGIQYDRFLHVIVAFLTALVGYALFGGYETSKQRAKQWSLAVSALTIFAWEAFQSTSDRLFGTEYFHDAVQTIVADASEDVLFGFLGLAFAAAYLSQKD